MRRTLFCLISQGLHWRGRPPSSMCCQNNNIWTTQRPPEHCWHRIALCWHWKEVFKWKYYPTRNEEVLGELLTVEVTRSVGSLTSQGWPLVFWNPYLELELLLRKQGSSPGRLVPWGDRYQWFPQNCNCPSQNKVFTINYAPKLRGVTALFFFFFLFPGLRKKVISNFVVFLNGKSK